METPLLKEDAPEEAFCEDVCGPRVRPYDKCLRVLVASFFIMIALLNLGYLTFQIMHNYVEDLQVEEAALRFNVTELSDTMKRRWRAESAKDTSLHVYSMKRRFIRDMLHNKRSSYVCIERYASDPNKAVHEFEKLLLPHFQISTMMSSSSELCFYPQ